MKTDRDGPESPEEERLRAKAAIAIYLVGALMVAIGFVAEGCF